jgi:hypothetical protein
VADLLEAAATIDGFADKSIFLTDSAATSDALRSAPRDLLERVRGTRPSPLGTEDLVNGNFIASYATEYDEDSTEFSFTAHSYDMTWIVALGSAWALLQEGSLSGENIARGVRRLSEGEEVELAPSNWDDVLDAFAEGRSVDVRGASGALDYSSEDEETTAPVEIWTIDTRGPELEIVTNDIVE